MSAIIVDKNDIGRDKTEHSVVFVVRLVGFEPTTYGLEVQVARIQLSYLAQRHFC